ncbi:MAG: hypothetical protein M3Q11_07330, partial [Pseudomonadota bacterium]|nr:hypothetical protein [Pseudomonadota bacterium]
MNTPAPAAPRRFATIAEIELLEGYAPENPVTMSNYKRLLGPYHLNRLLKYSLTPPKKLIRKHRNACNPLILRSYAPECGDETAIS